MTGRPADPRPVDADLATLREAIPGSWEVRPMSGINPFAALDRVEAEIARLEEEAVPYELVLLLEAEQLEVQLLREERDTLIEHDYWASQTIREQERELVRLRETLARVRPDINPETGYGYQEAV